MQLIHRWRWPIALFLGAAAIGLWPHFRHALQVDNSLTAWFIEGDPALESYYRFQENFGNDEVAILLYYPPEGMEDAKNLRRLKKLSDSLEQMPSLAQVLSAGNARVPPQGLFQSQGRPLLPPKDSINPQRVWNTLAAHPFLAEQFFTPDRKASRVILRMASHPDFEQRRSAILDTVRGAAKAILGEQVAFGGVGILYEALNSLSKQDFGRFLLVGYLLMFALIWLIYRQWTYVFFALGTILLSTYFTLALYGWAGYQLNLMTTLVPAIIILLCVMDVMHILNERHKPAWPEAGAQELFAKLRRVWRPCLFTTLTTAGGFLTLTVSPIKILFLFGLYSALGIGLGLLFSFYLAASILPSVEHQTPRNNLPRQLVRWQNQVLGNQKAWLGATAIVLIFSFWGLSKVVVDTDSLSYLPVDHPARTDSRVLEEIWGPYMPLEYLVYPQEGYTLQDTAVIRALLRFDQAVRKLPDIGGTDGYHSLFGAALKGRYDTIRAQRLGANLTSNVARLAERHYPELLRTLTTADYKLGRLNVSGNMLSAGELNRKMNTIDRLAQANLGEVVTLEVSGYQSLYGKIVNYVTNSQINSFLLATGLIFMLLWIFLRQFKLALVSLLPNFFPICFMLGFMGWYGIQLDTATACIASIVLSFSIDDTMHFAYHYQRRRQQGLTPEASRRETMAHVGRAILLTSLVLFTGYALMVFGALKTVIYFGSLTAVSIVAALFSQLVLFPILLAYTDRSDPSLAQHKVDESQKPGAAE